MRIPGARDAHLTYCLNVHPGESWSDNLSAIRTQATQVRDRVSPASPFGLGLRLSNQAAETLAAPGALADFRSFLEQENLYVFTINGFPYGQFHDTRVKADVYKPDWRTQERLDYTRRLTDILAGLIPPGLSGSISTLPGSYGAWITSDADRDAIFANLVRAADHCRNVYETTGKTIRLALEPEPDCWIESTDGFITMFEALLATPGAGAAGVREHLGFCFDTCHLLLEFEDLKESLKKLVSAGIRIPKIQVSAALKTGPHTDTTKQLHAFDDDVYLHQVRIREGGTVTPYADLAPALEAGPSTAKAEWRVHCHVPLYHESYRGIASTADALTPGFFAAALAAGIDHFEMETYTFTVLPDEIQAPGLCESLAREYAWVLERMP